MTDTSPAASRDDENRIVEREFRALLDAYLSSNHRKKVEIIERAFRFARHAHRDARRRSGEPYILHPIAVARIVISELGLGSTSICAALLHDVVEDTDYTREDIETHFGPKIAAIVEGLTKISGGIFGANASLQAANFRKLLLSMSTDIRVVLIKMADRLHNMRTLGSMTPQKQFKIAGETLYVYAPLAHRLGLFKIKTELEDLAFRYEHPQKYAEIMAKVSESEAHRTEIVEKFVGPMREHLTAAGFKFDIKARVKSAYSIYKKMETKKIPFEEIYDIYAIRVIFDNDDDELERMRCWQIYSIFTDGHQTHPDRLRDWTNIPKANGYRALHLTCMGPDGRWIEVQIRSRKMDEIAELGYAAHWKYKTGETDDDSELDKWMNTIKDILANPEPNAMDLLDTIKLNLYSSEIYVFTPKGDLIILPSGSTVLDLAFEIHSELGTHCIAGKINHRLVPLDHRLDSGDQVEIITSRSQTPKREWLGWCHTAKATNCLRNLLRKDPASMIAHGRKLFEEFMHRSGVEPSDEMTARVLRNYRLETPEDLYMRLARDEISLSPSQLKAAERKRASVLKRLLRNPFASRKSNGSPEPGHENQAIDMSQTYVLYPDGEHPNYRLDDCCQPVPGDDVLGFVNENNEVVVHKMSCPKAMVLKSGFGSRIVATRWSGVADKFTASISVQGIDRLGILSEICTALAADLSVDVRDLSVTTRNEVFECHMTVRIDTTDTIGQILAAIRQVKGVKIAKRIS